MFKNYYNDTDIFQIIVIDINILKKITKISIFKQMTLLGTIFPKSVDISIIGMAYRYIEHPYNDVNDGNSSQSRFELNQRCQLWLCMGLDPTQLTSSLIEHTY